jgi:hypothetical protein
MRALVRWTARMVFATLLLGTQAAVAQPTSADALVEQYYVSILGRASDAGGKAAWVAEAARATALGIDVKEAFIVMAGQFFNSGEYLARQRDDAGYVTDLYQTFFNRAPDPSGLTYWTGLLAPPNGVSRAVLMNGFVFSPEFSAYMAGIPGNATSRPEIYASVDFYRGLMGRLPDNAGFNYWLNQFQTSQCGGAGMVYSSVEIISAAFVASTEYVGRGRSDADYVSDLYYAFLRRSADQAGYQFWLTQLATKAQTRDQLRKAFIASPEFTGRVNAIIQSGCVPSPAPCTLTTVTSLPLATDVPAACGITPAPTDGSCDVTLKIACTGGVPTSYGWSSTVANGTVNPNTAPPISSQKVTVTAPQTFTVGASNASGTGYTNQVLVTVGGSSGGGTGGTAGAVDCSAQGFGAVHYIELPLNQTYSLDTYSPTGYPNIDIPPGAIASDRDIVVIKFRMPLGAPNLQFAIHTTEYPVGPNVTTMAWSDKPCDWNAADPSTTQHWGPWERVTQGQTFTIGGPDTTGAPFIPLLSGSTPASPLDLYLIFSHRHLTALPGVYNVGDFTGCQKTGCNFRITVGQPLVTPTF